MSKLNTVEKGEKGEKQEERGEKELKKAKDEMERGQKEVNEAENELKIKHKSPHPKDDLHPTLAPRSPNQNATASKCETSEGPHCAFPMVYDGESYGNKCIMKDHHSLWCFLTHLLPVIVVWAACNSGVGCL